MMLPERVLAQEIWAEPGFDLEDFLNALAELSRAHAKKVEKETSEAGLAEGNQAFADCFHGLAERLQEAAFAYYAAGK